MLRSKLTPRPVAKAALRARRPPDDYIDLLSRSEGEFLRFVQQLEQNPLFGELVKHGVISRIRFRGRLPREKYEEHMDREFLRFLETYEITKVVDWDKDFFAQTALNRVPELARKYRVPEGTLVRFLRYLRSTTREAKWSTLGFTYPASKVDTYEGDREPAGHFVNAIDYVSGESRVDISDIISIAQEFVEKYGLTEQEFINDILSGEMSSVEISETFKCSLREAEEVLAAAATISFAESYESSVEPQQPSAPVTQASTSAEATPIAFVRVKDDGSLALEFDGDSVYVQRYRIRLKAIEEPRLLESQPELRDLIDRARFVNQRLTVLSRVITSICDHQKSFLVTGNPVELRPLSQADISRSLKEHQSTISRIIRNKTLATPHGTFPLTYLCQSKTDVIARLVQAYPDKPDIEMRDILLNVYNCRIARRTVAYHRGKRMRRKSSRPADGSPNESA